MQLRRFRYRFALKSGWRVPRASRQHFGKTKLTGITATISTKMKKAKSYTLAHFVRHLGAKNRQRGARLPQASVSRHFGRTNPGQKTQ